MSEYKVWEVVSERHKPYIEQLNERMHEEYRLTQLFHKWEETSPEEVESFGLEQTLDS